MKRSFTSFIVGALILVASGCSVLRNNETEKEIRAFVSDFGASMNGPDSTLLTYFHTEQSDNVLLRGLRIIQNRDNNYVQCEVDFNAITISIVHDSIRVQLPALLKPKTDTVNAKESKISLLLERTDDGFVITRFDAYELYDGYSSLNYTLMNAEQREKELLPRRNFYARAHELQKQYDSVIWYTFYEGKSYYYVVEGKWVNDFIPENQDDPIENHTMGLVNEDGKVIVPLEYDLVETPGMAMKDVVEVRKNGRFGYYRVSTGEQLIPADYDWIVPYATDSLAALVKKDTSYGWIDTAWQFHAGLPDENAKSFIHDFKFMPEQLTMDKTQQPLCEIPKAEFVGFGIVCPPSYLTAFGLGKPIIGGIVNGEYHKYSNYDFAETKGSFFKNITATMSILLTSFTKHYVEGREEFYSESKITLIDKEKTSAPFRLPVPHGDKRIRKTDSTTLEIRTEHASDYDIEEMAEIWTMPYYVYFRITDDLKLEQLRSTRRHEFTAFVKLDSSYITGKFSHYNPATEKVEQTSQLTNESIERLRNDILAYYGYIFKDNATAKKFSYSKVKPAYASYSQLVPAMTEIDRHNLFFLEKIVGTLDPTYNPAPL